MFNKLLRWIHTQITNYLNDQKIEMVVSLQSIASRSSRFYSTPSYFSVELLVFPVYSENDKTTKSVFELQDDILTVFGRGSQTVKVSVHRIEDLAKDQQQGSISHDTNESR
jgi:hypothetical protein